MNILLRLPVRIVFPGINNLESFVISRKILIFKRPGHRYSFVLFKYTYITFMLSCSRSLYFICIEKTSATYLRATQTQKLSPYGPFTNTLPQKSTHWL